MQWWNDFLDWFNSDDGWRITSTAVIPFIAIVIAAVIAALIGRGSTKRVLDFQNRELQSAAVAAMIDAGRTASKWNNLGTGQQQHADSQFSAADIRLRLLPITGASAAADWATHQLADMRKNSASFSFQADQTFVEFRDRLLEWQRRPSRARKLFALDLERFRYEDSAADAELVEQQRAWAAEEAAAAQEEAALVDTSGVPAGEPAPTNTVAASTAYALASAPAPTVAPVVIDEPAPTDADTTAEQESETPEPVAAPDHVNAAHDEPAQDESTDDAEKSDEVAEEEKQSEPAETQALPLSYFDPVPTRPAFPVQQSQDTDRS
jgi:hypothetical protein